MKVEIIVNPLFNWGMVFRYVLLGAVPLILFFILVEKLAGEWSLGFAINIAIFFLPAIRNYLPA